MVLITPVLVNKGGNWELQTPAVYPNSVNDNGSVSSFRYVLERLWRSIDVHQTDTAKEAATVSWQAK